jgi:hypothetical protein
MAANNNNSEDCLTINADTHPADILEWLAKILEPGHYCQSRDADGKLVLNVDHTGGAIPLGAHIKSTNLMVRLKRRKDWSMEFLLTSGDFILAFFHVEGRVFPSQTVVSAPDLESGLLVDESFSHLLQEDSCSWEARALFIFKTRLLTFKNLCGPFSRLTPLVSPGYAVKSANKV